MCSESSERERRFVVMLVSVRGRNNVQTAEGATDPIACVSRREPTHVADSMKFMAGLKALGCDL